MKVLCVIPARYASTRLPGKPLANLAGKPMIQRVYERAAQARFLMRSLLLPMMNASRKPWKALAARP